MKKSVARQEKKRSGNARLSEAAEYERRELEEGQNARRDNSRLDVPS